jgi:hypothetical protein
MIWASHVDSLGFYYFHQDLRENYDVYTSSIVYTPPSDIGDLSQSWLTYLSPLIL